MSCSDDEIRKFRALLRAKLHIYEAYHWGTRRPQTDRARHFVDVARGVEMPVTLSEQAYLWHLEQQRIEQEEVANFGADKCQDCGDPIEEGRLRVLPETNLCGFCANQRSTSFTPRTVSEPLGSREDFKRDSGRNWSSARKPKF